MRKIFIILTAFCLTVGMAAQTAKKTYTVSGVVKDNEGEAIIAASVIVKNQPGVGVRTDIDGKFSIKVPSGSTLVFSYVGLANYEYEVQKDVKDLEIIMKPDEKQLEEVVVVGMGSQKKASVVGAITSIDVKELSAPATSINNMMGGRIPGIISMQTSGEPGKNISQFWVRGIGTFGVGNSALILIDGLEGTLDQIDPTDVESFSVLKDASATAVYGIRGANGVVLVTTKRGKAGKLSINFRSNYTISQLKRLPKYLRAYEYAKLANEAREVSGQQRLYGDREMELIEQKLDRDLFPDVNWQKQILNPISHQQTYYINAQGGGDIARYFISTGYSNESAAYKQEKNSKFAGGVAYQKFTYRANIDINLTKSTKVYMGLDGYQTIQSRPGVSNTDMIWYMTRTLTPLTMPTRYSGGQLPTYGANEMYSPITMLNEMGSRNIMSIRNLVTMKVEQDLGFVTKGLSAKFQIATEASNEINESRLVTPAMYRAVGRFSTGQLQLSNTVVARPPSYMSSSSVFRKYQTESQINWGRDFGGHAVGAMVNHRLEEFNSYGGGLDIFMSRTGISLIPYRYQALAGRFTYGFRNTYFADFNWGYNGSANFQTGKQYGFFPAAAVGWVPTEYEIMRDRLPWLSFLKLRYSYGIVGNDRIHDYRFPYLTIVQTTYSSIWGYNGRGIQKEQVGATNLKWETATVQDFGIEGKLFKNALTFTVDVYKNTRDNIFQRRTTIPDFAGLVTMPYSNVGSMFSYGTDGNVAYTHVINKNMDFTVRGNYTYSANHVSYFEEPVPTYPYQTNLGYPWGVQRGLISLGLFKDENDVLNSPQQTFSTNVRPGDIKYKDVNSDGIINEADKVPIAYPNFPRLVYGFGGEFRYKEFSVGVMFKGVGAVEYFRSGYGNEAGWIPFVNGEMGNVLTIAGEQKNRWTPAWYSGDPATENPNAMFPRLSYGNNQNNSQLSTFWKADGSYIRMQELNLSYTFRGYKVFERLGISNINLQFVANNLFTIDKVKYFDPEQAAANGGAYPIPARYSLQMFVNF